MSKWARRDLTPRYSVGVAMFRCGAQRGSGTQPRTVVRSQCVSSRPLLRPRRTAGNNEPCSEARYGESNVSILRILNFCHSRRPCGGAPTARAQRRSGHGSWTLRPVPGPGRRGNRGRRRGARRPRRPALGEYRDSGGSRAAGSHLTRGRRQRETSFRTGSSGPTSSATGYNPVDVERFYANDHEWLTNQVKMS